VTNRSIFIGAGKLTAVLFALILGSAMAVAQVGTATISGAITDSTGGAVPNATVTARNMETGVTRTVQATDSGQFSISPLQIGPYEVSGGAKGFKQELRRGITLVVGQEAVINLTLQIGNVTEEVTVTDAPPLVNTTLNSTEGLINAQQIKDLPLNGRSFDQLLTLNAGTVNNGSNASANKWDSFSVMGQRPDANRYLMNGIDYVGTNASGAFISPLGASNQLLGVEAVREFNVMLYTYGVEYGKRVGAQISIVSNTGGNQFHGDVFEYMRNNAVDARNYFDATKGAPPFHRNQFGGAFDGPILRNRMFFFLNYEGFRQDLSTSAVTPVPDAQARQGMLPCYVAYPTTYATSCGANQGGYVTVPNLKTGILPYVGNYFWPAANGPELLSTTAATAGLPTGIANFVGNPVSTIQEDYGLGRIDYTISSKDSASVNFTSDEGHTLVPSVDPAFAETVVQNFLLGNLQETHIATPNLINTVTLGYSRAFASNIQAPVSPIPTNLDFLTGVNTGGRINIAGIPNGPQPNQLNEFTRGYFTETDDVHYNKGKHLLTFGAWFQQVQQDPKGSNVATAGVVAYPTLLAFLQDAPTQFQANANPQADYYRQKEFGFYAQDEIKFTSRFTARFGLREESTNGYSEAYGHSSNYLYDSNGIPLTTPMVGSSALTTNHAKFLLEPRVGLVWDPTGDQKWSVKTAFGIYRDLQDNIARQLNVDAPFNAITVINNTPLLSIIPVPTGIAGPPSCSASSTLTPPACSIFAPGGVDPNFHTPTLQQWSFSVERQLTKDTSLLVSYVGSESYHVISNIDTNVARPQICATTGGCLSGGNLAASKDVTVPVGTLYEPATPGMLPNPYVGPSQTWFYNGTSNYHGLNAELTDRPSYGLTFKVNYTYSKSLDDQSGANSVVISNEAFTVLNPYNLRGSYGPSTYNVGQIFNFNYVYQLPFGSGRAFLNSGNGFVERAVGGWTWTGNYSQQTGFPFTPLVGANTSGTGDTQFPDVPNHNPNFSGPIIEHKVSQWYNPNAFTIPLSGTFGNVARSSLIGPGLVTFGTSLIKDTKLAERVSLQLRFEAFNVFNHANFAIPNTTVFSGTADNAAAGAITATSTTSRQLQAAAKIQF
jgi:hypothetical protein